MQGCRIRTATDDIGIAPVVSVSEFERIGHLSVDFILPLRVARGCPRSLMSFGADVDGMLQDTQFHWRLAQTHINKDGPDILHAVAGRCLDPVRNKAMLVLVV